MVALASWLTAVVLLVFLQTGLHFTLNRRRYRAWDGSGHGWNPVGQLPPLTT